MPSLALRIVVGALILTGVGMAGGMVQAVSARTTIPPLAANPLPWQIAANVLVVAVLSWIAFRSRERGWRLALSLGLLLFGIASFNSFIEARFFGLFDTRETLSHLGTTLLGDLIFAPLLVLLLRAPLAGVIPDGPGGEWRARITPLRLISGGAAYVVVYFVAGMIVFPFVREFYATKPMPNPLALVALQAIVRGPVFVLLLYLALRMSRMRRSEAVLMTGTALSVLGGIAPLMVPNPYFPDAVRWSHFFEVGVSNFVYGAFAGWLLTRGRTLVPAPDE